jgi:transposase
VTAVAHAERLVAVADLGEGLSRLRLADASALAAMRASLKHHGQLSPVRAFERDGAVEIFDGFKRLRAARGLGLRDLRAVVTQLGAVEATVQMRELHAGRGLTAIEEAWIVRALYRDYHVTQGAIAALLRCHKTGWWANPPEGAGYAATAKRRRRAAAGGWPMKKVRFVGLDVHKESIAIAVAESDASAPQLVGESPSDTAHVIKALRKLARGAGGGTIRCCYEAGPTGFGLCRSLRAEGFDCSVIAPSLVPKQAGDRVKTDSRDAVKLARFLRSGDLTAIHVPDASTEAMRDLERGREDAKNAERVVRHQLSKFLLRQGRRYAGTSWTDKHMAWIRALPFEHEAHHRVLVDHVHAVEEASARVARLDKDIAELVESWSLKPLVRALQGLRGVRLLTAVVIAAELGDMARFAKPAQLMGYLGLVPSEHSSGETTKRGGITRTGNTHVRRILIESAWAYRFRPALGPSLRKRNQPLSQSVRAIAWKAQLRLHSRYARLLARGKNKQQTVTAIARELVGFVWAIAQQRDLLAA